MTLSYLIKLGKQGDKMFEDLDNTVKLRRDQSIIRKFFIEDVNLNFLFFVVDFELGGSLNASICNYNIEFGYMPFDIDTLVLACHNFCGLGVDMEP